MAASSADAGIVYATDAASMPEDVTWWRRPGGKPVPAGDLPVAVVAASSHPEEAQAFVGLSADGGSMEIFEAYGFADGR